jgi:hypothetical protein
VQAEKSGDRTNCMPLSARQSDGRARSIRISSHVPSPVEKPVAARPVEEGTGTNSGGVGHRD